MSIEKTPWQILNSIAKKDFIPDESQIEDINSFWLCKWLSNDIRNIIVSEILNNNYKNMNMHSQYWFSRTCVDSVPYFKQDNKKDIKNTFDKVLFETVKMHYMLNNEEDIYDTINLISCEEKLRLIKKYSHFFNNKDIENILKKI